MKHSTKIGLLIIAGCSLVTASSFMIFGPAGGVLVAGAFCFVVGLIAA